MKFSRHVLRQAPVLLALMIIGSAPYASAQQIPPGCFGSGISISIQAFHANGDPFDATTIPTPCETIKYVATLAYLANPPGNCAFQEGALVITTPDLVSHDATPPGGIFDPNNPGGPLTIGSGTVVSIPISYVVDANDLIGGFLLARTSYNQNPNFPMGISFTGANPPSVGFNNGGTTTAVRAPGVCPSTFCAPQLCDPTAIDPNTGFQGVCVAGTPPVCTVDPGLDPACFMAECDPQLQQCVGNIPIVPTPPVCTPPNPCGNNGDIRLASHKTPAQRAAAGTDLDSLRLSMRPATTDAIDPTGKEITVQITSANGVVFSASLPAGSMVLRGRYYRYTNAAAKTAGGISRLTIWQRPNGQNQIYVDAWGDLSGATADMLSTVIVGGTSYNHDGTWKQLPIGWRVR